MNKKIILVVCMLSLIVIIPMTSAGFFDWLFGQDPLPEGLNNTGAISIQNYSTPQWNIIKSDGNEDNFKVIFTNLKDKKTDICFVLKDGVNADDVDLTDKLIYDSFGVPILDNQDKDISIKYETAKCDGQDGYHLSLTEAKAINIDEYIKLGENSLVIVYEETKEIIFSISDTQNISAKLYWDINGDKSDWNNSVNELFVFFNQDKWKFGAYHNDSVWERYKYVLESEARIENRNGKYYFRDGLGGYKLDPSDICSKINNQTNETADCQFNTYTTTKEVYDSEFDIWYNVTDKYFLEIEFYSDSFIDPSFTFENLETQSTLNRVRFEGDNSTHISINDSSLILYMPFDSNLSQTTVYDFTNNDNDGTIVGNAHFNNSGVYGGAFKFDGGGDSINLLNTMDELDTDLITYSFWILIGNITAETFLGTGLDNTVGNRRMRLSDIERVGELRFEYQVTFEDGEASWRMNTASEFPPEDVWHYIVISHNQTNANNTPLLYIDGINITDFGNTVSRDGVRSTGADTLAIGTRNDLSTFSLNGSFDDFMIFNTTLNESEIIDIYNNQSSRFFPTGVQEFKQTNLTLGVDNIVNLSIANFQNLLGSNFSARVGYWNVSNGYNVSDEGLVAYWGFNENAFDLTSNENDGTITGAINGSGVFNGSYEFFDDDFITIPFSSSLTFDNNDNITIAVWIKPHNPQESPGSARIINQGSEIVLQFGTDVNNLDFILNSFSSSDRVSTPSNSINTDEWNHIIAMYNGTEISIYLNGVFSNAVTPSGTYGGDTNDFLIGSNSGLNLDFNGSIDEVSIYNRSLSADEIKSLYVKGLANWNYTEPQNISSVQTPFQIPDGQENFYPELTYLAGISNFYSPILEGAVQLDTWNQRAYDENNNVFQCGVIDVPGIYTLNQTLGPDIATTCITINSSDVVFNGQGFTIDGIGTGSAILLTDSVSNVTINNVVLQDFQRSLAINSGSDNNFFNNINITKVSSGTFKKGIEVSSSGNIFTNLNILEYIGNNNIGLNIIRSNNQFINGSITGAPLGIDVGSISDANLITGFTISGNDVGIKFRNAGSDDYRIYNNIFNNTRNVETFVGSDHWFNTTFSATTSIIGGANSGGNYWGFPNGTGGSDICTVTVTDNICDNPINSSTSLEQPGATGVNIDELPLSFQTAGAVDNEFPIFTNIQDNNGTIIDSGTVIINSTITSTNGSAGVEFDGVNFTATNVSDFFNVSFAKSPAGDYTYFFWAYGNGTDTNFNTSQTFDYTINASAVDNEFPVFTNIVFNITNGSEYFSGTYEANATLTSTNGTVGIEFDGVNFTTTNLTDVFTANLNKLKVADYNYFWWAYGNGTDTNFNNTETFIYSVVINSSLVLGIAGTTPIEYPAVTDVAGSDCPSELVCTLNKSNQIYPAGIESFNFSTDGNENYTGTSSVIDITINQNNSYVLDLTATTPITYGTTTDFAGSGCPDEIVCALNISNDVYTAGTISANFSTDGNNNYTGNSTTFTVTIDQAIPEGTISGTTPIDFGTAADITGSESNTGDGDVTYQLFRDDVLVSNPDTSTLPIGTYNYVFNTTGGTNYTANASMDTFTLIVSDTTFPLINFTNPTPFSEAEQEERNVIINISIIEENLKNITWNWNGTNNLLYDDSLVLFYNFDNRSSLGENDSLVVDLSNGGNNGTVNGAVWNSTGGKYNGAYEFKETISNINLGTFNRPTSEGTISAWVKPFNLSGSESGNGRIVKLGVSEGGTKGFHIRYGSGSNVDCYIGNGTDIARKTISAGDLNEWTYYSCVFNGTGVSFYENGIFQGSDSIGEPTTISYTGNNIIGAFDLSGNGNINGSIDDVMIFNRTLSAEEIRQLYYSSLTKFNDTNWNLIVNESNLGIGNFSYNATACDSSSNCNSTETRQINIIKSVPEGTISGTTPIDFGTAADITGSESNTGDGDVTYQLFRDDVLVSNPDTSTLGVASYEYIFNTTGGTNYTANASMDTFTLVVNQIASEVNLTLNGTEGNITILQGDTIDLNATLITGDSGSVIKLYNEGVLINSGTSPIGNITTFNTPGEFNITVIYESTQNYTQSFETFFVNVTAVDSEFPTFATFIEDPTDPATYSSGASYEFNSTITSTNGTAGIEFDGVNFTASNLSDVFNSNVLDLSAATYNYFWWAYGNGTDTNFNISQTFTYTVDKATGQVSTFLNEVQANLSSDNATIINITGVLDVGVGNINMTVDGVQREFGVSPLQNLSLFTGGVFLINVSYAGNENYTADSESWTLTITNTTAPSKAPWFTIYDKIQSAAFSVFNINANGNTNITRNLTIGGHTIFTRNGDLRMII